jgi:FAD-dependent urate hydroxylase
VYDLDVVIIGGGIGGLTSAIALQRAGHRVRVFDQVRELRPVGAGISLWSNGVKVLNELGLGDEVAAIGGTMDRMAYADVAGEVLCDFSLDPLVDEVGQRPFPVVRSELQDLLMGAAGADRVQLGARCIGVSDGADVATAHFEDGTELQADVIVAADGTHSRLREHVVGHVVPREYAGYVNWNGLVSAELGLSRPGTWQMWVGEGKRVSVMPVGGDRLYFFFDVPLELDQVEPREAAPDPREQLAKHFAGWAPPVLRLVEALDPAATNRIPIHDHEPVDRMARGRVALLGDAAHSTAPDLGQGGCQAMEDALVLSRYLTTTTLGVADALGRYCTDRVDRTTEIMRRARARARLTHAHDPAATDAWYDELRTETGDVIIGGITRSILAGPCN